MTSVKIESSCFERKERKTKMKKCNTVRELTFFEEVIHAVTHGIGALLSVLGLVLLMIKASGIGARAVVGTAIFGASMIILFTASCLYHTASAIYPPDSGSRVRATFQKCDHSMIFLLILGTYSPACVTTLGGFVGWSVFGVVAACCVTGIVLNWISVAKFEKISLFLQLLSGWSIVVAFVPFYNAIGPVGCNFLVAGGLFYTVGVVFYKLQNIKYFHVVWHIFVLLGALMHYVMIYSYCM